MRGVSSQRDLDGLAAGSREDALGAHVVLHIARTLNALGVGGAFKLSENLTVGLASNVGKNIQASAVRHTNSCLV